MHDRLTHTRTQHHHISDKVTLVQQRTCYRRIRTIMLPFCEVDFCTITLHPYTPCPVIFAEQQKNHRGFGGKVYKILCSSVPHEAFGIYARVRLMLTTVAAARSFHPPANWNSASACAALSHTKAMHIHGHIAHILVCARAIWRTFLQCVAQVRVHYSCMSTPCSARTAPDGGGGGGYLGGVFFTHCCRSAPVRYILCTHHARSKAFSKRARCANRVEL